MSRLAIVTSDNVFYTGFAAVTGRGIVYRNNRNADYWGAGYRSANTSGLGSQIRFGQTDLTLNSITSFFLRHVFRARKTPNTNARIMSINGSAGNNLFTFRLNTAGTLSFFNNVETTLVATSAAISIGIESDDWTVVELFVQTSTGAIDTANVIIRVNGTQIHSGTVGGSNTGLNQITSLQSLTSDVGTNGANNGAEIDFDCIVVDDAAFPVQAQYTVVPITGAGNYTNWAGGNPDFRFRSLRYNLTAGNRVSTTNLTSRQSYAVQSLASLGVTGSILSATVYGIASTGVIGQNGRFFIRRNGVDDDAATWTWSGSSLAHTSRFSTAGWAVTDSLEIGFESGAGAGTYQFFSFFLLVEHSTPFVAPPLQDVQIQRINYTGTGALQTISLPFIPDFIMMWPRTGTNNGAWWWTALHGFKLFQANQGDVSINAVVEGSSLYLLDGNTGYNQNTIVYDAILIRDRQNRIFGSSAFYQVNQASPFDTENTAVLTPLTSPIFLHSMIGEVYSGTIALSGYFAARTGMATNTAIRFDSSALQAERVQELTATGWTARKGMFGSGAIQYPYFVLKPGAFEQTRLVAVANYVGDGVAPTPVTLDLGGLTPVWVLVFPHGLGNRFLRNNQQSNSKMFSTTGESVNAITALGADSITVGSDLNSNGVTYTVVAFAEGTDSPQPNQFSGIYFLDPNARHDTLWDRPSGGTTATTNVKIPDPTIRTFFPGDR